MKMSRSILILFLLLAPMLGSTQSLELLTSLNDSIKETSSLLYLNQKLITNNDSGGLPELYEIDSLTGNVIRTVTIVNSENVDWEALCSDSLYIYIGDFGNNTGSRTDLKIYRIPQNDFFDGADDAVYAEAISFHYADQTNFTYPVFQTNYDAEAFIAMGDSLYIFTKNWGDHHTSVYPVPKTPGDYALTKMDSIDVGGLVTGAYYNSQNQSIMLSCYTLLKPFAFYITEFPANTFSEGVLQSIDLQAPAGYSHQIEGVAEISPGLFYFTSEGGVFGASGLFKMELYPNYLPENHPDTTSVIYPNPGSGQVYITNEDADGLIIYDASGQEMERLVPGRLNFSAYQSGVYLVKFLNAENEVIATKRLVIP